jgi:hypothetical protein
MTLREALANLDSDVVHAEGSASESHGFLVDCNEAWALVSFGGGEPKPTRFEDIEFCLAPPDSRELFEFASLGIDLHQVATR